MTVADQEDDLGEDERAGLDAALDRSLAQAQAGATRPAEEVLKKLETRR